MIQLQDWIKIRIRLKLEMRDLNHLTEMIEARVAIGRSGRKLSVRASPSFPKEIVENLKLQFCAYFDSGTRGRTRT